MENRKTIVRKSHLAYNHLSHQPEGYRGLHGKRLTANPSRSDMLYDDLCECEEWQTDEHLNLCASLIQYDAQW